MTQADKDLLLKDLCARLPYGVVIQEKCVEQDKTFLPNKEVDRLVSIDTHSDLLMTNCGSSYYLDEIKPYLFPISSMTEEQKEEFNTRSLELQLKVIDDEIMYEKATEFEVDFYNKHHLDWRGLIPKGLALDATGLNIY